MVQTRILIGEGDMTRNKIDFLATFESEIVIMSYNMKQNINEWVEVDEDEEWSEWVVLLSNLEKDEIERRLALIEVRINLIKKKGVKDVLTK